LLRRATELAAANQELEAFAYSVSHDLRAPLQGIELSMALLEDEQEALSEECREYLQRVRSASRRMAELILSLLKLSKITMAELRREPVDLSGLAQAIAGQLQKVQPERPVHVEISPGITASADPQLLRVALENLLGNAWKFTSNQPAARIEVGAEVREGEEQVYFVRDNGAGFDMAKAGKLFVPFQRLHETAQFEGVGIGLATVHRIIHKHGGRIWAEAAPEKGATFYFTLP
jgi:light-regulated signal transduction histidine kinase (bacteriophytochrome)